MIARIQGIDDRQQLVLARKRVQVHNHCFRRLVQLPGPVEELPPQGLDLLVGIVPSQLFAQVG
jgi:hypothetical protein